MIAAFAIAEQPIAKAAGPAAQAPGFPAFVLSNADTGQFLVDVQVVTGSGFSLPGRTLLGDLPLAVAPIAGTEAFGAATGGTALSTLRYGDRAWYGDPTDADQPNTVYEDRLDQYEFTRSISSQPEGVPRQQQNGAVILVNGDGALDTVAADSAVDGRSVTVRFGPYMNAYNRFQTIARLEGVASSFGRQGTVEIDVTGRSFWLSRRPVQTNLYGGTGGADGGSDLEGKQKPLAFGIVRNVPATLIDATNLIYQVHDGAVNDLLDVYDQALALTDSGNDVADYVALVAQAVSAGEYATANAVGMFKLGASPAGLITVDLEGDATGSYTADLGSLCIRILESYGNVGRADINLATFLGIGPANAAVGYYIGPDDTVSVADAINYLIGGVGAHWGDDRDGRIRASCLCNPDTTTPAFRLDDRYVVEVEALESIVPRKRQRLAYKRRWVVQNEDISTSITDARRSFIAQEFDTVAASDSAVEGRHPKALDPPPLVSPMDEEADAQAVADRLLALHKRQRRSVVVQALGVGYLLDIGKVVRLTWPEYGLSEGRNFVVVGLTDNSRDLTELTLWG